MDDEKAFRFLTQCTLQDFIKKVCRNHSILCRKFAFRTLWSATNNTYRCCPCAFQHEFCDYVRASGEIDRDVVESLACSISTGCCPHAFNEENIRITNVSGITIATARGVEFIQELLKLEIAPISSYGSAGSVFGVEVNFRKEILLERDKIEAFCRQFFKIENSNFGIVFTHGFRLICAIRQSNETCSNHVTLEYLSLLEYCLRNRNVKLIKKFSIHKFRQADIERAVQLIFRCNHGLDETDVSSDMYEYIIGESRNFYRFKRDMDPFGILAIIYNQNHALCQVLHERQIFRGITQMSDDQTLSDAAREFKRYECLVSLENKGFYAQAERKDEKQYGVLDYIWKIHNFHIVKGMIDMGAAVTIQPLNVSSYETIHLSHPNRRTLNLFEAELPFNDRSLLELYIYENEHIEVIRKIVEADNDPDMDKGDDNTNQFASEHGHGPLEIKLDMEEHGMFGHEGDYDFALNFTGPLMIECGYPITKKLIHDSLREGLHPSVKRYLEECMETPRSLELCSRDVLRQTFKGRTLHKFVENQSIPRSVRDYILLKPILKCLDIEKLTEEEIENTKARNYIDTQTIKSRITSTLKQ